MGMLGRVPPDYDRGTDLVESGYYNSDPDRWVQQPRRDEQTEPEQQVVAPEDADHAQ